AGGRPVLAQRGGRPAGAAAARGPRPESAARRPADRHRAAPPARPGRRRDRPGAGTDRGVRRRAAAARAQAVARVVARELSMTGPGDTHSLSADREEILDQVL